MRQFEVVWTVSARGIRKNVQKIRLYVYTECLYGLIENWKKQDIQIHILWCLRSILKLF